MPYKDDLDAEIAGCLTVGYRPYKVARKVFSFRSSPVLQVHSKEAFEILDEVATHFRLQFRSIVVVGSAQTGYSYVKDREFKEKESDLDLAVIDTELFCYCSEEAFLAAKGYRDLTGFKDQAMANSFREYLSRGIFRPDMMPSCSWKNDWFTYFNRLSMKYAGTFASVNCGVYQSDVFFESKQSSLVSQYKKGQQ
jgi:hypothetical protein